MNQRNFSTIELKLEAHKAPEFKVSSNVKWVLYGTDQEWRNRYPDYLLHLFNTSAKHNAIIRGKTDYITGQGWEVDKTGIGTMAEAQIYAFVRDNDLTELLGQVAMDLELYGGAAIEVIYNATNKKIARLCHVNFAKVRVDKECKVAFYSADGWKKAQPEKVEAIPVFNASNPQPKSILYVKLYSPDKDVYPLPSYIGAIPYVELDGEIANFHLNGIKNGFMAGTIINFFNGTPTEDDRKAIEQKVNDKFAGSDNANKILLTFNDTRDQGPEIAQLNGNDLDKRFDALNATVQQEVFTGHRIVDPALFGIKSEGLFTSRNQIRDSYELFQKTYISARQSFIEAIFNGFLSINDLPQRLRIKPTEPIQQEFSEMTLVGVMTPDEIRAKAGLPVQQTTEADTVAKDAQAALKGTVGGVTGIITVLQNVQQGIISSQSAVELLIELYGFERPQAESIVLGRVLTPVQPTAPIQMAAHDSDARLVARFAACGMEYKPEQVAGRQFFTPYTSLEDMEARELELSTYGFAENAFDMAVLQQLKANPQMGMAEIAAAMKTTIDAVQMAVNRNIQAGLMRLNVVDVIGSEQRMAEITEAGNQALKTVKPLEVGFQVAYRYVLGPGVSGPDVMDTTRDFCADMVRLSKSRVWTQAEITRISLSEDRNVWQRRGGFWTRRGTNVTTHYCRHAWERVLIRR